MRLIEGGKDRTQVTDAEWLLAGARTVARNPLFDGTQYGARARALIAAAKAARRG